MNAHSPLFRSREQHLLPRVKSGAPEYDTIFHACRSALAIGDKAHTRFSEIRKDATLTAAGHKEKIGRELPDLIKHYADTTRPLRTERAQVEGRLLDMRKFAIDRTDVVAALDRHAIREFFAGLPAAERLKAIVNCIDQPGVAEAILTAPLRQMTGLSSEQLAHVEATYLEKKFGADAMKSIAARRNNLAEAEAVARVARNDLRSASGLQDYEFEKIAEPIEAAVR